MEVNNIDEDFRLWALLIRTRDVMRRAREAELKKAGISSREASVLLHIRLLGNKATPAEIARWQFRRPHGVGYLVDRMERKGLVKKIKDLDRKNLIRVEMTEKGWRAYEHAARRRVVHEIMSRLSEEERQQLGSLLQKLRIRAYKKVGIDYIPPWP